MQKMCLLMLITRKKRAILLISVRRFITLGEIQNKEEVTQGEVKKFAPMAR